MYSHIYPSALYRMVNIVSITGIDNIRHIEEIDTQGTLGLVLDFPEQCENAANIVSRWSPRTRIGDNLDLIIVSGLGGSAIAGDMAAAVRAKDLPVPMLMSRDYSLPAYVTDRSLVICASYSGITEETLSSYADARRRGASIVCITSGGKLAEMAETDGVDLILVPGGQLTRFSTGYMFIAVLFAIEKLGIVPPISGQLPAALELLRRARQEWSPEVPSEDNDAKLIAQELYTRIPLMYGSSGISGVISFRWKCQFNDNAKIHAFSNTFPELHHNEILGWELASLQCESFAAIFIRDPADTSRVADKVRVVSTLIPRGFMIRDIILEGQNDLEKLLWGFYLGDIASIYLAVCYDVDPSANTGIDRLKEELVRIP